MLGANHWHFYLTASRCIARLGVTKGWVWDKVMETVQRNLKRHLKLEWHGTFYLREVLIRILSESDFRDDVWKFEIALLSFDSSQLQIWTSVHQEPLHRQTLLSFMFNLQCSVAPASLSYHLLNLGHLSDWLTKLLASPSRLSLRQTSTLLLQKLSNSKSRKQVGKGNVQYIQLGILKNSLHILLINNRLYTYLTDFHVLLSCLNCLPSIW